MHADHSQRTTGGDSQAPPVPPASPAPESTPDPAERDLVLLEIDGPIATITNNRPHKHNAMSDAMDRRLWEVLAECHGREDLRAIVWQGAGPSFSSGRDTTELGVRTEDISDLEFIERGHRGAQMFFTMPCPIVVALHGWVVGGAFERALLCDLRIAGENARMMLPEVAHGVIPDSGGVARLFQMAGHGLAADLALTGRSMDAHEARMHGVVSRVVPDADLAGIVREVAEKIAAAPAFTVKMARRTLSLLATAEVQRSIAEEALAQSMVFASSDYAAMKAARREGREPTYRRR